MHVRVKMTKVSKKQHLKTEHLLAIVTWLEHSPNFERCFGVARQTSVGKQSTKTAGFKAMAETLAKSTKFVLGPKQMRERFTTFKNKYLRAKAYEDSTGAGISAEDERNGIHTMSQKMESICPCYDRMDKLFGEKANVEPLDAFDSTVLTPSAKQMRGGFGANDESLGAFSANADNGESREEVEYAEDVSNNTSETPRDEDDISTPGSLSPSYALASEDFCSIPLAQLTPDSFASPSPLAATPDSPDRDQNNPCPVSSNGGPKQGPRIEATTRSAAEEGPRGGVCEPTSRRIHAERTASESRPSKKPRKTSLVSLNSSPTNKTGSGSRIANAMAKAAEAKANVERNRLTFDKEKWSSEAEQRSMEQKLERERFAFEKAKWESEREDRRSAMQLQQRFQMLSSLIEKGHNVDEAKDFLALL